MKVISKSIVILSALFSTFVGAASNSELKLVKAAENIDKVGSASGSAFYTLTLAAAILILLFSVVLWFISNKSENGQGRFTTKNLVQGLVAAAILMSPTAYTSLVGDTLNAEQHTINYRSLSSVTSNQ